MKVFCVGLTTKDSIFYLKEFPKGEGKHLSKEFTTCGGGPAATAAAAITRLGGDASLWSRVGDDLMGEDIINELKRYRVNTQYIEKSVGTLSTNATVVIDQHGERLIISYSDPNLYQRETTLTNELRNFILSHDLVLVDTRWSGAAKMALDVAREAGIPSILDGEVSINHSVRLLAPLATYSLLSYKGFLDLGEQPLESELSVKEITATLAEYEARWGNRFIVTRGEQGALYLENGSPVRVPAYKVKIVDTLGAGDVFHGAFAAHLLKRYPLEDALRHASAAAAMKCTASGGRGCLPTPAMLKKFLETATPIEV